MDNLTFRYRVILVEGLQITHQTSQLTFIFLLIAYVFIIVSNIGILIQISAEKRLHQPMHILFCHLPVSDVIGATVLIPRLLKDLLTDPSERYITYVECVFQAFFVHLYGTTSHTILMIGLSVRLSHCKSFISNHFCDNASLFKLSCENTVINNVYGLTFTVVLLTSSLGWVLMTYLKIAMVCLKSRNKATNSKAIKTCSTHLIVYVILFISGFVPIFLHRFSEYAENRKFGSVMFHVIPPGVNPIIYGLQVKEIRQRMLKLCRNSSF
ncbi:olfactory receptor 1L3-like [Carassius gibelio]|uniref:olfactory receptor 1L3-like n=1 Tax=Carassius gibelio TaxID=101364 RepID=UPI002278848C|nr:olfactory receptor 1L3-like [Carassius gibelio]